MTEQEAKDLLKVLAREFGVKIPKLRWSLRRKRGRYTGRIIIVGPKVHPNTLDNLLHEFAHHLDKHSNGFCANHERAFCETLERVVRFHYGDASLYPWKIEYQCVRNYAIRSKLYTPQPVATTV